MPSGTFLLRFAGNVGLTSPLNSKSSVEDGGSDNELKKNKIISP